MIKDRAAAERGIAVVLVVVLLHGVVVGTALAIDLGRLWVVDRSVQRAADVAALDAARHLAAPFASPDALESRAIDAAVRSAARNGVEIDTSAVELGHLIDDEWSPVQPGEPGWPPTAVAVSVHSTNAWLFRPGSATRQRSAIAQTDTSATILIGSDLLDLSSERSDLLAAVLGGLMGPGAAVDLTAVGWEALASASITLDRVVAHAGVVGMHDHLGRELPLAEHLEILAATLEANGDHGVGAEVRKLAQAAMTEGAPSVRLSDLLDLTGADDPVLRAELGVLDLVHRLTLLGAAGAASVGLDTTLDAGPLAAVRVHASVIDPPRIATGPVGTSASTAQVSTVLDIELSVLDQVVDQLAPMFSGPLGPSLRAVLDPVLDELATLHLSLELDAASATTVVSDIACRGEDGHVDASTTTALVSATVTLGGVQVPAVLEDASSVTRFDAPFGWERRVRVTGGLALATATERAVADLVESRLVGVLPGPLTWLLDPVIDAVHQGLTAGIASVQHVVMDPTLTLLGTGVGNATVAVVDARCGEVRLVR